MAHTEEQRARRRARESTPEQRARRRARENTPEFREAHRLYEAKRRAGALAQWLVDHPGFTLADREFATRMRLRKERRKRFGPMVGGRLTSQSYSFDNLGDEL
jgi:hypothetical protein